MNKKAPLLPATDQGLQLRIRVFGITGNAFGPGKAELLEEIERTGSMREAAARMKISYMKAWRLANAMNANFREPLLEKTRGGSDRGGTKLTEFGRKALTVYQKMTIRANEAVQADWRTFSTLLKK